MKKIIVIGGGGHAKVVISILKKRGTYNILGYTDIDNKGNILGVPYLGNDEEFLKKNKNLKYVAIGIGQIKKNKSRKELIKKYINNRFDFPVIISPDAIINEQVEIGKGSIVMDGAVINSGTKIGSYSIINTKASIEHDCNIGDFTHIAPGVTLSGGVKIGNNVLIGTGVNVIQYKNIVDNIIIGAGATVIKDINEQGVYVGNPARKIK